MTVHIRIGRRIPRSWYRRAASKAVGLMNFQENIWLIISQSLSLAKKKANKVGTLSFVLTKDMENEDMHYQLEWISITIRGTREQELEEYNESMMMYNALGTIMKKEFPINEFFSKMFKTKMLSQFQVTQAYERGYGASSENNIASKLLEMGIMTHIELENDYDSRTDAPKVDF